MISKQKTAKLLAAIDRAVLPFTNPFPFEDGELDPITIEGILFWDTGIGLGLSGVDDPCIVCGHTTDGVPQIIPSTDDWEPIGNICIYCLPSAAQALNDPALVNQVATVDHIRLAHYTYRLNEIERMSNP